MANERLILAIGQMERALSRIETAAARTPAAPHGGSGDANSLSDLHQRHDQLKSAAAKALADIDAILASKG